jgi:hypothetical protein
LYSMVFSQSIFPGAQGFGSSSRGAYQTTSTPTILTVDTLYAGKLSTSATSGSFEWCLSQKYPRIILFAVSGVIDYTTVPKDVIIENPYLTIYGQTAPKNGITLLGAQLLFRNHDMLIQHVKFRCSEHGLRDYTNVIVISEYNVVIDHCSISFADDELFTIWNADSNITLSNSIVAFPLQYSKHAAEASPHNPEGHGFGLIDKAIKNVSYIQNLTAYTTDRSPLTWGSGGVMLNNFFYTYCGYGPKIDSNSSQTPADYAIIGNVYLPTTSQKNVSWKKNILELRKTLSPHTRVYLSDNVSQKTLENPTYTQWQCITNNAGCIETKTNPMPMSGYTVLSSQDVESYVLAHAGAFYWDRDRIDQMVVDSVSQRTMDFISSPEPLPARAYNMSINEGLKTTNGNMQTGYDFSVNPVSFTVNTAPIHLTGKYATQAEVLTALNSQLPSGTIAVDHPAVTCYHIVIQTTATGKNQSITIGGDASVFGIANGTYYGENGIGGYPSFTPQTKKPMVPENPHQVSSGGYTNLEIWASELAHADDVALVRRVHSLNTEWVNVYAHSGAYLVTVEIRNTQAVWEKMEVFNAVGNTIFSMQNRQNEQNSKVMINMRNIARGMYLIKVKFTTGNMVVRKISVRS